MIKDLPSQDRELGSVLKSTGRRQSLRKRGVTALGTFSRRSQTLGFLGKDGVPDLRADPNSAVAAWNWVSGFPARSQSDVDIAGSQLSPAHGLQGWT